MRYITVLIAVAGLVLAALPAHACDLVNAYIEFGAAKNQWVLIGDSTTGGTQNCSGTLYDVWEVVVADSTLTCPSNALWPSANRIWGNGLSGTYRIATVPVGNCVKLCACTP